MTCPDPSTEPGTTMLRTGSIATIWMLASGSDAGDFGADLRALILSLKYCGNMSEPKIREFLENFDVQVSSGSVSNILTKTADSFRQEFDELVQAGLASRVTAVGEPYRYEARPEPHYHATCRVCGRLYDVPACADSQIRGRAKLPEGFHVEKIDVTIRGVCLRCRDEI